MTDIFRKFRFLVRSDLWRYGSGVSLQSFISNYLRTPGFRYSFWLRVYGLLAAWPPGGLGPRQYVAWRLRRLAVRFGISIPADTKIGPGFYIGHYGGIVVHHDVTIGANCNLSHGVTLGLSSRGDRFGCPTIGDAVYIGPGAKIFGAISVGNCAAIGANAVVTRDVPARAVVAGVPARIISEHGSAGYICNIEY